MLITSNTITVEMTREELFAIKKFIGATESTQRKEEFGLTDREDFVINDICGHLSDFIKNNK